VNDDDDGCVDEVGVGCCHDRRGHRGDRHRDEEDRRHQERRRHRARHQGVRSRGDCRRQDDSVALLAEGRVVVESACRTPSEAGRVVVESACQTPSEERSTDRVGAGRLCPFRRGPYPWSWHRRASRRRLQVVCRRQALRAWLRQVRAHLRAVAGKGRWNHSR